ncbi:hypothetical protein EVA_02196 [gut metagenome]|uniref:Uncharacterized protein n=1 Tax=gut metagenome TaxID=749906 RepID=J9H1Q0_9ZZZZ
MEQKGRMALGEKNLFLQVDEISELRHDGAVVGTREDILLAVLEDVGEAVIISAVDHEVTDFGVDFHADTRCDAIVELVVDSHVILCKEVVRTVGISLAVDGPNIAPFRLFLNAIAHLRPRKEIEHCSTLFIAPA